MVLNGYGRNGKGWDLNIFILQVGFPQNIIENNLEFNHIYHTNYSTMKISFIGTKGMNLPSYSFGGFETVISELAPRLVNNQYEVIVYARKKLYPVHMSLPILHNKVKIKYLSSIESKNFGTLSNSLLAVIDSILNKTDIVFVFNIGIGLYLPILKLFGIKVVTNLDGVEWERDKWSKLAKVVFKIGAYLNSKFADVLIADAEGIKTLYKKRYNVDSVVIPYGAEIRDDISSIGIEKMGLKKEGYFLLTTRFVPENNPLFIIENYLKSSTTKPLIVLGRNYYNSEYENKIKMIKSEKIIFIDHINDRKLLLEFYKNSYVYIHGHSVGGTNPTMLEALANSACILAHNNKFNREMLLDGKYGVFFDLDPVDFIMKVNDLDKNYNKVQKMKNIAKERIINYYNWDLIEKKYLKLLSELLK